jgi:hypothetical protein
MVHLFDRDRSEASPAADPLTPAPKMCILTIAEPGYADRRMDRRPHNRLGTKSSQTLRWRAQS